MRRQGAATLALQRPAIGSGGTKLSVGRMSLLARLGPPTIQLSRRHQGHCGPPKVCSNEQSLRTRNAIFFGVGLDSEITLDAVGLVAVDRGPARIVLLPRDTSFLGCLAISKQSAGKRRSMTIASACSKVDSPADVSKSWGGSGGYVDCERFHISISHVGPRLDAARIGSAAF